jgi:hypothetical protein
VFNEIVERQEPKGLWVRQARLESVEDRVANQDGVLSWCAHGKNCVSRASGISLGVGQRVIDPELPFRSPERAACFGEGSWLEHEMSFRWCRRGRDRPKTSW